MGYCPLSIRKPGAGRHGRAGGRRGARGARQGARPGRAAGPVGYALSLFLARFDSVLFLSRLLDIVREPGS